MSGEAARDRLHKVAETAYLGMDHTPAR